ncbi:MAG: fasciclin domain-containing protein [Candidatus Pedobacter colombiensis]|uniref:Fasciclin domain-containing protein n=1 Tax=Candidatus Pedobacter colombiensis TaxID=3121371 RepID=A0AAJ5WAR1_9SPHI|nr:fasciclin domain-containing protein [Pedobacter sp.]WEK19964.1 MAG: fasciclin domain-containing protein [Pedobacter sp.]
MKTKWNIILVQLSFWIGLTLWLGSCKNEAILLKPVKADRAITQILKEDDKYTSLVQALDRAGLSGLLNIYGSYTLFAPNNDAFKKYLQRKNLNSITDISADALKKTLLYHLYSNQYNTSSFIAGSLPALTALGEYISMDISKGVSNTVLNGSVKVKELNVSATNGVIHEIDDILEPPAQTTMDWLKAQPKYSIITEAFQKTGVDAVLNQVYEDNDPTKARVRYTAFLETDSVLALSGINSFAKLAAKYSKTGNYTNLEDSLNIFMRYHLLKKNLFISDFRDDYLESVHATDFITFSTSNGIYLNPHYDYKIVGGVKTDSIFVKTGLLLSKSNTITKNGVVHSVNKLFSVYSPTPQYVMVSFIKDCTLWPNCNAATGFKTLAQQAPFPWIIWFPYDADTRTAAKSNLTTTPPGILLSGPSCFRMQMLSTTAYIELTTPKIFKGTYDVLYNWEREASEPTVQVYIDGVKAGDPINQAVTLQNGINYPNYAQHMLLTTLKFDDISEHKIKIVCVTAGIGFFDAIEFRPR